MESIEDFFIFEPVLRDGVSESEFCILAAAGKFKIME